MWADRETDQDLLGFDVLVESIFGLLEEPQLMPLTVGLDGDWGSGKSSLLSMVQTRIEADHPNMLVVPFSPWMHEGYADSKAALVDDILGAIQERAPATEADVRKLRQRFRALTHFRKPVTTLVGVGSGLAATGLGYPEVAGAAAGAATKATDLAFSAAEAAEAVAADASGDEGDGDVRATFTTAIAEFRNQFAELLAGVDGLERVVVLVDDVDRCLPDTVVETFEMIRMFSDIENTVFIIAAHRTVVGDAINARYRALGYVGDDGELGHRYLEKMWHTTLSVPPLTEPEVETYLNLLVSKLHLADEEQGPVLSLLVERGPEESLTPISAEQIRGVLEDVPTGMASDLQWVMNISDVVANGLLGNPRKIKRFANRLLLAQRVLARRGLDVDPEVLAKLMLLDELLPNEFATLMRWSIRARGASPELQQVVESEDIETLEAGEVKTWASNPTVQTWVGLEPDLTNVDLRPYIHAARDRSRVGGTARTLTGAERELLERLLSAGSHVRSEAVKTLGEQPETVRKRLVSELCRLTVRRPSSKAPESLLAIADRDPHQILAAMEALKAIPVERVPINLPAMVALRLSRHRTSAIEVLDWWVERSSGPTQRAAEEAAARLRKQDD